jgi:transcriptional regulator with XRE-family HTH domain
MNTYRLKELRKENNKTQKEVAQYLNIEQNTYSQYENGQRQLPIEVLIKLTNYYDVSADYILNLTDIETRNK